MHPTETAINDYVDGTSDPFERNAVEAHVATCAVCRRLVDDLREIKRATGTLELREPPVRAWGRIERAIKLEQENNAQPQGSRRFFGGSALRKRRAAPYWLAAAAVLLLATLVGLRYVPGRSQPGGDGDGVETSASASRAAEAIESELRLAESHYENAIKGLEQAAQSDQDALDPRTAATLQKNLAVIDQAISESRAAMRAQPSSGPAQQSLIENFKTKIALLQDTVALINEMRKGNDAGAARIVSGLKQKG
jgi:anti-sigma factor RsiW